MTSTWESNIRIIVRSLYPQFEPSESDEIKRMLDIAEVFPSDLVFDIGCGKGDVLAEAVSRGARAIGVDHSSLRVGKSRDRLKGTDVAQVVYGDIFEERFWYHKGSRKPYVLHNADVVTMFLNPYMNSRLRSLLEEELSGTRVVSNYWPIEGWNPVKVGNVGRGQVFLYSR